MKELQAILVLLLAMTNVYADNPPITPAWAFRHVVWEDSLNTSVGAQKIVDGYLQRGIPVGAVIIDSPWSTSYNDFNWDRERYPEPEKMIGYFKNKDVKVLLWLTGAVNFKCKDTPLQKGDTYDEAVAKNLGVNNSRPGEWWKGEGIHIDFTNKNAKEWWYRQLDKVFIDGVYGWKVDQGEYWFGDTLDTSVGRMSNAEFRPYYYDAMYDYTISRNPAGVIIARPYSHQGGYASCVKKLNMGWCGDFSGDWNGLKQQIDNIYNSALRGYGSLACEVGGFYMARSTMKQLIRYAQFGCMTACMINGGENGAFTNHLPWYHGEDAENIYRTCVILHEELVPYLFSSSVDANISGGSLMQSVNFIDESHRLGAYLFTKAITSDNDAVSFVLPDDGDWIDFWSGDKYVAGSKVTKEYSIDRFPLFVKQGSVLPVEIKSDSFWCMGMDMSGCDRTFVIYPNASGSHVIHIPRGDGLEYDDYVVRYDMTSGQVEVNCPIRETVGIVFKGIKGVKDVKASSSWRYDSKTGDLKIMATGKDISCRILN